MPHLKAEKNSFENKLKKSFLGESTKLKTIAVKSTNKLFAKVCDFFSFNFMLLKISFVFKIIPINKALYLVLTNKILGIWMALVNINQYYINYLQSLAVLSYFFFAFPGFLSHNKSSPIIYYIGLSTLCYQEK